MKRALALLFLVLSGAGARAAGPSVPAYSASYVGTLAGKPVTIEIDRFAGHFSGSYHYGSNGKHPIALSGTIDGEDFTAAETVGGKTTGLWRGKLTPGRLTGVWSSPDKKKSWPLDAASAPAGKAFPYGIRIVLADGADRAKIVANQVKPDACNLDRKEAQIIAIELVDPRSGSIVQSLGHDVADVLSQGACRLFMPIVEDMNFDGWPDLRIARELTAGPNVPFAAWLYDPATRRLVFNGDLSQIVSPRFDARDKAVTSTSRGSCCSYESDVYRWHGDALRLTEQSDLEYVTEGAAADRHCWTEKDYRSLAGKMRLVATKKGCGDK